jgi:FkbM family methyltransferase
MKLNLVEQWFKPSNILDIGANIGLWQTEAKKAWPDAYIYSIEANTDCEPWLQNLGCDYKICLLTKDENNYNYHKKIYGGAENAVHGSGNSIYKEKTLHFVDGEYETESIKGTTLDSLFEDTSFDLIKIDTQGSELDIIKGGMDLVSRAKGLLLEVTHEVPYNEGAPLYGEVVRFLNDNLRFFEQETLSIAGMWYPGHQKDLLFVNEELWIPNQ